MSTRKSRQLGNKYIKEEDIQNYIYDSDEENPNKVLSEEREEAQESRNKGALQTGVNREDPSGFLRSFDFSVLDRESGKKSCRLNESSEKCCESSRYSGENKLKSSTLKEQQGEERKSVFNYFESASNKESNSEEKLNSSELKKSENCNKDTSREEIEESSEDENSLFPKLRKRPSLVDTLEVSDPKRFKVELEKEMTDAPATKPLKIELELEKNRQSEPIKKRNINTITEELDEISKRWNDCHCRYKQSFQWGPRITKICSEKWDFHYFPQKIYEAYQKWSEGSYSPSSRAGETCYERGDSEVDYKVESRGVRIESDKVDEEGSDAFDYEQYTKFSGGSNPVEENLNPYSDGHGKMILRSSNQNRNRQDGRISNDVGMSEQSKEKASKKASFKASKDKKKLINPNRQLVVELERCSDPHRQCQGEEALDSNKNFEDIKGNFEDYSGSSQMNANKAHYEENSAQGPMRMNEDDKVSCPICHGKFDKNRIVAHANSCATAAFPDY